MRVAITGSSGLIGTAVREAFARRGWGVTRIVRSAGGPVPDRVSWDPESGAIDAAKLESHDVVVHLAGEPIAGVWTRRKMWRIEQSRLAGTTLIARALAGLTAKPRLLLSSSAVGYYGHRDPATPVTEDAPPGRGFLAEVAVRWEGRTKAAADAGIRVVLMRTGNVLSPKGGMLAAILPLFRLGLGARLGSGQQIWPWIALEDMVQAILHAIDLETLEGPVNFVAPEPVSNAAFTRALASAVNRFAPFTVPSWAARLAPGGMADEILLAGAHVVPKKLLDSGYAFRWPELEPALKAMLS